MKTTYLASLNEAGTTNNNSGKSPYVIQQFKANNNFKHLNVVIMMRMTYTSLFNFYENVDMRVMRAFVTVVEREGCHGDEMEMMPRQHSDDPVVHGDTGAKEQVCGCAEHAKDGGVIPNSGSHGTAAWQTRKERARIKRA